MIAVLPWLVIAVTGAVVVGLLALWLLRGRATTQTAVARRIDALTAAGDVTGAARVARDAGRLDVAFELFLQAKDLASAAAVAVRRGDLRRAANLYEQVGDWAQAIEFYDQSGLHRHASTLRRTRLTAPVAAVPAVEPQAGPAPAAPGPAAIAIAAALPELAIAALAPAIAIAGSAPAIAEASRPTRAEAGALVAEGDFIAAAELFAELGLDDEATHLWVNVLGEPGRAATLVAERGHHERAAELYEVAGDLDRAAMAWVDAARAGAQPERFLERLVDLAPTIALGYLEQELTTRPLSATTAEWHYHKARAVERGGDARRAMGLYLALQDGVGSYRDIEERVTELGRALLPREVDTRIRRSTRAPIELPPEVTPPAAADASMEPRSPASGPSIEIDGDQLRQMAAQVAEAATDSLRRRSKLATLPPEQAPALVAGAEARPVRLAGAALDRGLLDDSAVEAARRGPSLETLLQVADGRTCDLGNIEVFYRIGLRHQSLGNFVAALTAFGAVEDTSPGYRDAWKRIEDLRRWLQARATSSHLMATDALGGGERYELRGELGRGHSAVVYRAFDQQLGRDVALKFMAEAVSGQRAVRERFLRQAQAAAAISHPNLVTIHDTGILADRAFISMELVDGQPVETLMREPGGLSIVESLRIMKQVLAGLSCLHGRAIIHHDVKPANIMRTTSGLVKVMDVGLVIASDPGQPAVIGGTPPYLAPELLGGHGDVDQRVDIFAAAAALFEMLSGTLPYQGLDRHQPPPRLAALAPAVPTQLEAAIMRGLALDRDQRTRTAAELGGRIGAILVAINAYVVGRRGKVSSPPV